VIRFGLITGVSRLVGAVAMRVMDGLMSLPAILIGIAWMALNRASLRNVALSITVFVEAAIAGGVGQIRNL